MALSCVALWMAGCGSAVVRINVWLDQTQPARYKIMVGYIFIMRLALSPDLVMFKGFGLTNLVSGRNST